MTITSEIRSVPIGFVMAVQPAIDANTEMITLTLRPTVTRIRRFVEDPGVAIASGNTVQSQIPVIEVRELDSVLQLQSGQVAVLGGLMQERGDEIDDGIPILGGIPFVGRAFKSRTELTELTELVVLLRAQIQQNPGIGPSDRRLYQEYIRDPRPFVF